MSYPGALAPWLLYGTGALAARVARLSASSGSEVLLAGRSEARVRALAEGLGLPWRVISVEDESPAFLGDVAGVLNLAGPYRDTARPLLTSCLQAGAHYVDASNELPTYEYSWSLEERALAHDIAIVPGAGFGSWASEYLIHTLADKLGSVPTRAMIVMLSTGSKWKSPGVAASHSIVLSADGIVLRSGKQRRVHGAERLVELPTWTGTPAGIVVGTGDIAAISHSTWIQNVELVAATDQDIKRLRAIFSPHIPKVISNSPSEDRNATQPSNVLKPPSVVQRRLVAEVHCANGKKIRGALSAGSGSDLAAAAALAARRAITNRGLSGVHTAFQALGKVFPGSSDVRIDILPSAG